MKGRENGGKKERSISLSLSTTSVTEFHREEADISPYPSSPLSFFSRFPPYRGGALSRLLVGGEGKSIKAPSAPQSIY